MLRKTLATALGATLVLAACSGNATSTATSPPPSADVATTQVEAVNDRSFELPIDELATVSGPVSGNRVHPGSANLVDSIPVDISLGGVPKWIVAVPGVTHPTWVIAHDDGTLEAWRLGNSGPEPVTLDVTGLPAGAPPAVANGPRGVAVLAPPVDASPLTNPIQTAGQTIYVGTSGSLMIFAAGEMTALEVGALPDSRLSVSRDGLVSVVAGATGRYPHGVLGDELEAERIVVVDPVAKTIVGEAVIDAPAVIEGVAAPWIDANGDGVDELLVTLSDGEVGARLAIFDRDGDLMALGPPIGRANRWRNQLGAAPTGPNGETEIIDVRVPHIGGVVEFFRVEGAELVLVTEQSGFTSHVYGSRNLDLALAADVTGDGNVEVLAPTQDLAALGVLRRTDKGVDVIATLPLPGRLASNLAATSLPSGGVALAVGTSNGILRIYAAN